MSASEHQNIGASRGENVLLNSKFIPAVDADAQMQAYTKKGCEIRNDFTSFFKFYFTFQMRPACG